MAATQIPVWVALVLAVGSPLLAFAGVLLGQWTIRRSATDSELRWRREEALRTMRWAAEMAVGGDAARALVGSATPVALEQSPLLHASDQELLTAVYRAVVSPHARRYTRVEGTEGRP